MDIKEKKTKLNIKATKENKETPVIEEESSGSRFIFVCALVLLVTLLGVFASVIRGRFERKTAEYNDLKEAYDSLLLQKEALETENGEYMDEIESLYAENEKISRQLSSLGEDEKEKIIKDSQYIIDPYNDTFVSEYYAFDEKSWNLIENVDVTETFFGTTTDYIEINNNFYYAIYSPKPVTVTLYNEEKDLITSDKYDVSDGEYFDFGKDCMYAVVTYNDENTYFVSSGILTDTNARPDRGNYFYVVGKNAPANVTLSYAGRCLKSGGTILVLPGTYVDIVDVQNKSADIIGVDRSLCYLISYDKDYYKPPLEIAAGCVKNLTIQAVSDGKHTADLPCYGIHSDFNYLTDNTLLIDNCVIKSDYNASIGIGLRRGTITISNCVFDSIFFHDSDDASYGGEQYIEFINNRFSEMNIHSMEKKNAKVYLTFIDNTFKKLNGTNIVTGKNYSDCFLGLRGFNLTEESTGNTLSQVNY